MTHRRAPAAYSTTARVLHWVTAVLVPALLPLGLVIANKWGGPLQDFLDNLHRSIGAAIIPLIILRLGYRITHAPVASGRYAVATDGRACHALGTLRPPDASTLRRLGSHLGLSCTDHGFRIVPAAANLACGPPLVRSPFWCMD
jgi:hypothetical protein